jgi:hypothetical protein
MQHLETIGGTVRAVVAIADNARRLAAALERHARSVEHHQRRGALHAMSVALNEFSRLAIDAEAALTPAVRDRLAA